VSKKKTRSGPESQSAPAAEGESHSRSGAASFWPAALVVLATAAVFANALCGGFVWVDHKEIVQQAFVIDSWEEFRDAWTGSVTDLGRDRAEGGSSSGYFRPVQLLFVTLNVWLFGQNALLHHIPNIVLHALSALLLMAIVRRLAHRARLASSSSVALVCALLYAVHPIHVESVTWISGSKDTLAGFFFFGALAVYVRWASTVREAPKAPANCLFYICGPILFGLGLLTKEAVIVLPALLVLIELFGLFGPTAGRALLRRGLAIAGFGLVALVYLVARSILLGSLGDMKEGVWHGDGPLQTFLTMPGVLAEYAVKMLLPFGLTTADTTLIVTSPLQLAFVAGLFLVLVGLGLVLYYRKSLPLAAFGIAWFFVALLPVMNIFPIHHIKAERFVYLPSAGACLALAALWGRIGQGKWRRPAFVIVLVYLVLLSALTIGRNRDWADDFTLFGRDVARTPNYREGHTWLGITYLERGLPGDSACARDHLDAAARVDPAYTSFVNLLGLHDTRGRALLNLGLFADAVRSFEAAAAIDPAEPRVFMNLGIALGYLGRIDESLHAYGRAEELDPRLGLIFFNRARTLYMARRSDEALTDTEGGLGLMPAHLGCWNLRGKILLDREDGRGAAECFRRSLGLNPDQPVIVDLLRRAEAEEN